MLNLARSIIYMCYENFLSLDYRFLEGSSLGNGGGSSGAVES